MTLEQQVCSLELAKRLKELGAKQESLFVWTRMRQTDDFEVTTLKEADGWRFYDFQNTVSAFNVAELGELLKENAHTRFSPLNNKWLCERMIDSHKILSGTEADARAWMLVYLLENNLIGSARSKASSQAQANV